MEFDKTKLRRLDLGLLLVFLGLIEHRKAADVAADLGLTQSSISHALRRIRGVFEDELFLRRPHGFEPTVFALEIEPQIRMAVEALQQTLDEQAQFTPEKSNAILRISALDHSMAGILPKFVARVRQEAPGVRLKIYSRGRNAAMQAFDAGALDLAVGFFWSVPDTLIREPISNESYLIVGARDNPLLQAPLTLDTYSEASHLVVSQDGTFHGIVDRSLRQHGRKRYVAISVPMFFPAMTIVAQSDLLSALPRSLVEQFSSRFALAFQPPPMEIRPFDISVVRHKRDEKNQAILWAMSVLQSSLETSNRKI